MMFQRPCAFQEISVRQPIEVEEVREKLMECRVSSPSVQERQDRRGGQVSRSRLASLLEVVHDGQGEEEAQKRDLQGRQKPPQGLQLGKFLAVFVFGELALPALAFSGDLGLTLAGEPSQKGERHPKVPEGSLSRHRKRGGGLSDHPRGGSDG